MTGELDATDSGIYRAWHEEVARFGDTDQQGHINNVAYATYMESARVSLLMDEDRSFIPVGTLLVIARLAIDFRAEMHWRGAVHVGSRITRIGGSSFTLAHGIFQDDACTATGEAVLVMMDAATRKSTPLSPALRAKLESLASA